MENTLRATLAFTAALTLLGCDPATTAKQPAPPSQEEQLAGFWKLKTPGALDSAGVQAPRIMKLRINENAARQFDYCEIDGMKGTSGMGGYELRDGELSMTFAVVKRGDNEDAAPLKVERKAFSGRISRLDGNVLELDGKIVFERFTPADNSQLSDTTATLCAN